MAKINFTKEHYVRLSALAFSMLMDNGVISTKLGQPLNIIELLHTTTIETLNNIRISLTKKIETLENQDEWIADNASQTSLNKMKKDKELVNLIIGYKRYLLEKNENHKKREAIKKELDKLKESQKTPEDKIKELENELASLEADI